MKLQMTFYPSPSLREESKPLKSVTAEVRAAIPELFAIMYDRRGIGLAAPQAGWNVRLIVANLKGDPAKGEEHVIINPEILDREGVMVEEEGCLSLPGLSAKIRRAAKVVVRYRDLEDKVHEVEAEGLWSKLFQHEIDHLDGLLMIDKMSAADLKQWRPLLKELEEDHAAQAVPRRRSARVAEAEL